MKKQALAYVAVLAGLLLCGIVAVSAVQYPVHEQRCIAVKATVLAESEAIMQTRATLTSDTVERWAAMTRGCK
jgi:hypothetical protein